MARRRHTPEQVINKLREAEVAIAEGNTVAEASRRIGVTQQTFYRWRTEYGGLRIGPGQAPEESGGRPDAGQPDTERGCGGKLLSPSRRRRCVDHVVDTLGVSERRACRVLRHPRSTQRYGPRPVGNEKALTEDIVELASQFGRYGYRRVTALLRHRAGG